MGRRYREEKIIHEDELSAIVTQAGEAAVVGPVDVFHALGAPTRSEITLVARSAIGGAAESFDTNGLRFQKLSSDFFRAALGLGAGDLKATAAGERGATIEIPNVIFVDRKVHAIEKLISVKPERTS